MKLKLWQEEVRSMLEHDHYRLNDKGHQIGHADEVYENMLDINEKNGYGLNTDILFMIAYLHDMYCHVSRKKHHELACRFAQMPDKYGLDRFTDHEKVIIGMAIYEHRASNGCDYYDLYSLVTQMADRGKPDVDKWVMRSFMYHTDKGDKEAAIEVVNHLKEKFSRSGYGIQCGWYREYYKEELEAAWDRIDNITIEEVMEIVRGVKDE